MLSLTFKNLWARKWRSLMTAVAVIFGIALVAGTYIPTDTTNQAFDQIFNESLAGTDVVVTAKLRLTSRTAAPRLPGEDPEEGRQVDGVKVAAGSIFTQGAILDDRAIQPARVSPQFIAPTGPKVFGGCHLSRRSPADQCPRGDPRSPPPTGRESIFGDTIELVGTDKAVPFRSSVSPSLAVPPSAVPRLPRFSCRSPSE